MSVEERLKKIIAHQAQLATSVRNIHLTSHRKKRNVESVSKESEPKENEIVPKEESVNQ